MKDKYHYKIIYLLFSAFIFSIIYTVMGSIHFHGINKIQDQIKDDMIEDEAKEPYTNLYSEINKMNVRNNVKDIVKDEEDKIEKPNFYQKYLDSLYFSIITSCLLGYGDIYPITNLSKIFVSIQSFITLSLILF